MKSKVYILCAPCLEDAATGVSKPGSFSSVWFQPVEHYIEQETIKLKMGMDDQEEMKNNGEKTQKGWEEEKDTTLYNNFMSF